MKATAIRTSLPWLLPLATIVAWAAPPVRTLPGVVVTGGGRPEGTPASIDRIDVGAIPARAGVSASEVLQRVPGVAARDRQNLAQDVQLTIRGFGARSTFGVRGLRIFVDGIPATMPDGQGQVSHVAFDALARVDIVRGPFSALYGNASGGVIEFFSVDPSSQPGFGSRIEAGADAMGSGNLWWAGPWKRNADGGGYRIDGSWLEAGGYREHSRAHRETWQARLLGDPRAGTRLALTASTLDLHADDPQGLTSEQASRTPRAASAGAMLFDTRKKVRQQQLGLRAEQALGAHQVLTLAAWDGHRDTFQVLSVPVAAQAVPTSGGGVVDLDRDYAGADLRWRADGALAGRAAVLTVGIERQRAEEARLGFENFIGERMGVIGALRRNERDVVGNRDAYAEASWTFAPRWTATLGVRRSSVRFRSRDAYIVPGNPDDSGTLRYAQTTPVVGLLLRPGSGLELYANAGRGFETPSFSELGYRNDGRSGLNDALRAARSRNAELGLRAHRNGHVVELAAFASRTHDELVVASNVGGRSTYTNAASSDRNGWELSAAGPLSSRWHYAVAYTQLDAHYRNGFSTCRAPPCVLPDTLVAAGNRIPATAPRSAWAELRWASRPNLDLFAQGHATGRVYADDANSAHAPGYATLDLGIERRWRIAGIALTGFARIDNVLDRHGIGSVIVNEGSGRYFEPAPGRTWLLGIALESSRNLRETP